MAALCVILAPIPIVRAASNSTAQSRHVNSTDDEVHRIPSIHTFFLLDRSGSMRSIADDVISGFNSYLAEQQALAGDSMRVTLIQFDSQHPFDVVHEDLDVRNVPMLTTKTFQPRGGTPLYDAIGSTIKRMDDKVAAVIEEHGAPPDRVVVVVLTDGAENSSRKFSQEEVFQMVEQRKKEQQWAFVFLGANQDSYQQGAGIGISASNTQNYAFDGQGIQKAMKSLSRANTAQREAMQKSVGDMELSMESRQQAAGDYFMGVKEAESDFNKRTLGEP